MSQRGQRVALLPGVEMIDIVLKDGALHFLYFDRAGGLHVEDKVTIDGVVYVPDVPRKKNGQTIWRIPRWNRIQWWCLADPEWVFDKLVELFSLKVELPDQRHPILVAAWTAGTHWPSRFSRKLFLCFWGPPNLGKSLAQRWVCYVGHRGFLTSTLREAAIVRADELLGATLCIDVEDVMGSAKAGGSLNALLGSHEEGVFELRVTNPHSGSLDAINVWESSVFVTFATNKPLRGALATRAISIRMQRSSRTFPEADPFKVLWLREELIALRIARMPLVEVPKPFPGRFGDNWQVLLTMVNSMAPKYLPDLQAEPPRV